MYSPRKHLRPGRARPPGFSLTCGKTQNFTLEEDGTQEWSSSLPAPAGWENNWTRVPRQHLNPKGDGARMEGICLLQIPNSSRKTQWEKPVGSREKRREAAACIQTDRDALRRDDVKRWPGFRCEDRGGSRARRPHAWPTPRRRPDTAAPPLPQHPPVGSTFSSQQVPCGKEASLDAAKGTSAMVSPLGGT